MSNKKPFIKSSKTPTAPKTGALKEERSAITERDLLSQSSPLTPEDVLQLDRATESEIL